MNVPATDEVGAVSKTWEGASEDKSLMGLSGDIHTSQQRLGQHQKAEGNTDGPKNSVFGTEMSPNGIPTSQAVKDDIHTTQQLLGQFSLPGEDKVKTQ